MQNSGLGNAINPLVSLSDPNVYALPVLLLIGWRGEPGVHDEVQHQVQGRITPDLLQQLGIPFAILPSDLPGATSALDAAVAAIRSRSGPYALLVRQRCFAEYKLQQRGPDHDDCLLTREAAIGIVVDQIAPTDAVVSTTGFASRELYEYRHRRGQQQSHTDFYMVGSMGHATAVSLGLALARPGRPIWCLDGDGAALMHLGSMATVAVQAPGQLKHVVFNNAAHESVGGQPTGALQIGFADVADALGYQLAMSATSSDGIARAVRRLRQHSAGPAFLEIRICKGTRADLGRPTASPEQIKRAFMRSLAVDDDDDR